MDTKLKNNNNRKFYIVTLVAALAAAVIFMAFYPLFKRQASESANNLLPQEGTEFLTELYQFNYLLYYDIAESSTDTALSYADLYFHTEESALDPSQYHILEGNTYSNWQEDSYYYDQYGNLYDQYGNPVYETPSNDYSEAYYFETPGEYYSSYSPLLNKIAGEKNYLYEIMSNINNIFSYYSQNIDYCSINKKTGEISKNTTTEIERLFLDPSESEDYSNVEAAYEFYAVIEYNANGDVTNLSVKSQNPDSVLKSLRSISRNSVINIGQDQIYYYRADDGTMKCLNISLKGPKNSVYIYGLTNTQFLYEQSSVFYYYRSGISTLYIWFLCILFPVGLLLAYLLRYISSSSKLFRIPLEICFVIALFIILGSDIVIFDMVSNTCLGYYSNDLNQFLEFGTGTADSLVGTLNLLVLSLFFGTWLLLVSSLTEIKDLGIWGFLKKRCWTIRFCRWLKHSIVKYYHNLIYTDLNKDLKKKLFRVVLINFLILAVISLFWAFGILVLAAYSAVIYYLLRKSAERIQAQYKVLLTATGRIAEGDLDSEVTEDFGAFEAFKEELIDIRSGFKKAVDEELKSQHMKSELITNVSHDLKTPLTAIITYIDLLKNEDITEEERRSYIDTLDRKSLRLKILIEDLFEVSKASSRNVSLDIMDIDIIHLMKQVRSELTDKIEDSELIFRWNLPDEKVILPLDNQKTYRIFENLYGNILKYAMPGTRVYIDAVRTETGVRIELKNISAHELQISSSDLTERFIRGDSSRNTEGSGLGLAIAKSFVELQKGHMDIEVDGDLFKVILEW